MGNKMPIPTSSDYETFLNELSNQLKDNKGISFFIYGSHLRQDFVPGVSVIDGFFVRR